jgi:NDP-sugar pyrophosphorylase family protein
MKIKNTDLFESLPKLLFPLFEAAEYPHQVIAGLRYAIEKILENPPEGLTMYKEGILVGQDVTIEDGATILPPTVICDGATVRQGAYIRGGVFIGEGAVVGHSTEVKNSILMERAEAPHFNYVGDSILGSYAHIGAGVILSNLKADKSTITIKGETSLSTGMRKLGAILGDGAEVGCNSVLNPGSVIGKGSRVYPLVYWRGILPEGYIAKSQSKIEKKRI